MMADFNLLSWPHVATALALLLLILLNVHRARRKKQRIAEEEEWATTTTYPEEMEPRAIADALLRLQARHEKVSLYDYDTSVTHKVPVTDKLIRRARAGGFQCVTDNTDPPIRLLPVFNFKEGDEDVIPQNTAPMELTGQLHLPGRGQRPTLEVHRHEGAFWDCLGELEQQSRKVQVISAAEWAEMLMSGESDAGLLDTWIGEGVVFLPEGDALIIDRARNPVFSHSRYGGEELLIARSDKKLKRLVRHAAKNPNRALRNGALLLSREQWDQTVNETAMELDPKVFSKNPVAVFLFRDSVQRFAAYMAEHNVTFRLSLETDFRDLDYKLAPTTVSAVFLGDDHVVQARVEPLCLSGTLKQSHGLISLGSSWGSRYLHGWSR